MGISYSKIKHNAKKRNKIFDLSFNEYKKLKNSSCLYCGELDTDSKCRTIDRINSSFGYTIDNCVPCCKYCNRMKSDMTLIDWHNKMKKVISRANLIGSVIQSVGAPIGRG